jgi:hypothetical protein
MRAKRRARVKRGSPGLGDLPLGEVATRSHAGELCPAGLVGGVDQGAAIHEQTVEEADGERPPRDRGLHALIRRARYLSS